MCHVKEYGCGVQAHVVTWREEEAKFLMHRFKVGKLMCGFVSLILVVAAGICREP